MSNANGPGTGMVRHEQGAGVMVRDEGLAGREMVRVAEVQAAATAALVKAEVNARFELALLRPRNWMDVRTSLQLACKRPLFADAAIFSVKRGQKQDERGNWVDNIVEGASIRFIEEAIRCMRNVMPEVRVLVEDDAKRIVRVTMTDLENNITMSEEFVLTKVIERKKARASDEIINERVNSYGKTVYRVVASDDEMVTKQAAMVSKAIRNLGKRLLPSDIHDECMDWCNATLKETDQKDPNAARKRTIDAFVPMGVTAAMLEKFLGGPILAVHTDRFKPLKGMLEAMKEGMSWEEASGMADADGVVASKQTQADRLRGVPADAKTTPAAQPTPEPTPVSPMEQELAGPAAKAQPVAQPQATTARRGARGVPAEAQKPVETPHVATADAEPPADWKPTEGRQPGED